MANRRFTQFFYTLHNKPTLIDCNFIVDSTNGNGLGIRSLKGPGIAAVYMNTSATPAAGSPNPAAGYIMIKLQDNYNRYLGGFSGQVSPVTGSQLTSGLTVGVPYIITTLGASTLAQWQTAGLPVGITPAVGVAFIAAATSIAGGGGVKLAGASNVSNIEVVGDANLSINSAAPIILGQNSGSYIILQCMKNGVLSTPANGSVIGLSFYLNNSAQGV